MLNFDKDVKYEIEVVVKKELNKLEVLEIVMICKKWLEEKSGELQPQNCIICGCEIKDKEGYSSWNFGQNNLMKCEECK